MPDPKGAEPLGGRREALVERSLANVREAHQKALAMAVALGRGDGAAQPPPHQELARGTDTFQE